MNNWDLNKKHNKNIDIEKNLGEYWGLEQKLQQIVGSIKKSMMNIWD